MYLALPVKCIPSIPKHVFVDFCGLNLKEMIKTLGGNVLFFKRSFLGGHEIPVSFQGWASILKIRWSLWGNSSPIWLGCNRKHHPHIYKTQSVSGKKRKKEAEHCYQLPSVCFIILGILTDLRAKSTGYNFRLIDFLSTLLLKRQMPGYR